MKGTFSESVSSNDEGHSHLCETTQTLIQFTRCDNIPEWYAYYTVNAEFQLKIPWELGAEVTKEEVKAIASSLAAWQLGETSDGSHLLAAAKEYARTINDLQFVDVVQLFIQEEQRHGNTLGRFLDLAGVPRIHQNWGDTAFRWVRYSVPSMEIWVIPVIMVETIALIYYKAIAKATKSTVLQQFQIQILTTGAVWLEDEGASISTQQHGANDAKFRGFAGIC